MKQSVDKLAFCLAYFKISACLSNGTPRQSQRQTGRQTNSEANMGQTVTLWGCAGLTKFTSSPMRYGYGWCVYIVDWNWNSVPHTHAQQQHTHREVVCVAQRQLDIHTTGIIIAGASFDFLGRGGPYANNSQAIGNAVRGRRVCLCTERKDGVGMYREWKGRVLSRWKS